MTHLHHSCSAMAWADASGA